MKQLLTLIAVFVLFLGAYAQDQEASTRLKRGTVIKYLPLNTPLQSYSFEIERMLNGKNALTLGVGIPNNSSIIGKYGIEATNDLKKAELNSMHARLAYRHYTGRSGLPRGFYIEPYLKYQKLNATATIGINGDNNQPSEAFDGKIDAKISTMNAGFQMGTQFLIAKRVAIDFYFLGLEGGMGTVDLKGTPLTSQADPQKISDMRDEIQKNVNDLPGFLKDKIKVTSDNTSVNVKASQLPYPWLRAGISIGIAF